MDRCILAVTDGEPSSLGALRCAFELADRLGLAMEIASVCEPGGTKELASDQSVAGGMWGDSEFACGRRLREVAAQLPADLSTTIPIHVEIGTPGRVIGQLAERLGAELIVVGRESHNAANRLLREETAPRLMQSAHVPVLSVPGDYAGPPTRALVAVDFTSHSLDASCMTARLLPAGAELHLVHVTSRESGVALPSPATSEWVRAIGQEAESRMRELTHQMGYAAPHVKLTTHLREGRPAHTILALADELDAEMVAAGTSGYGFLGRLLVGSVATQLVRRTRRMTLVAPPRDIVPRCEARWDRLFTQAVAC